jgi:hypothetical protein
MNMKKTILVTLTIVVLALALSLTACGGDKEETPDPVLCDCAETYGTTAHLGIDETCPCPATEKPCGCTEQTATVNGTTIPIRKVVGVTVQQMNISVGHINTVYGYLSGSQTDQNKFAAMVKVIHIVSGNGVILKGTTLEIGVSADADSIAEYVMPNIILAQ